MIVTKFSESEFLFILVHNNNCLFLQQMDENYKYKLQSDDIKIVPNKMQAKHWTQ